MFTKNVIFKEKILQHLTETSNNIFKSFRDKSKLTEKQTLKRNARFIQKVPFEPLMDVKKNHCGDSK